MVKPARKQEGDPTPEHLVELALLAEIRGLHEDGRAGKWLSEQKLRLAAPGNYLALNALEVAYALRPDGPTPESAEGRRLCKAAGRALSTALLDLFGDTLPRVHFPKDSCQHTKIKAGAAFGVESDIFPSRAARLEAGEAEAGREVRRQKRRNDGDLDCRPAAEGGHGEDADVNAAEITADGTACGSSSRYLSELLSLSCGPALLELKLYPDAKELTESFAAFRAVREHLGAAFAPDDPTVTCICVGDGSMPRTGALFAYRTKWQVCAVDPQLKDEGKNWRQIARLELKRAMIEDCNFKAEKVLMVLVHAHVGLAECLAIAEWRDVLGIVALPCCNFYNRLQLQQAPLVEYRDSGVVSPHRLIRVWQLDGSSETIRANSCLPCGKAIELS